MPEGVCTNSYRGTAIFARKIAETPGMRTGGLDRAHLKRSR